MPLLGQTSSDGHCITSRVFKQKLRSQMNYIVKKRVFGDIRCWMYSIQLQKLGLPYAHILIFLVESIQPGQTDDVICAEIPDPETDPDLHNILVTNMINEWCCAINPQSPCMVDGKCFKSYLRKFMAETIIGKDGYSLYRSRTPNSKGRTIRREVKGNNFVVDNSWIVPYSTLLSKSFKADCNVENCHSVKLIKYICKYVTKGTDMAVFGIQPSISTMKLPAIKFVDMLFAMRRFSLYSHSLFTNFIPLLYIWRCIWIMPKSLFYRVECCSTS